MPVVVSGVPGKEGGDNIKQGVFSLHLLFVCWLLFLCILVVFRQHAASIYGFVRLFVYYVMSKKNLEHF